MSRGPAFPYLPPDRALSAAPVRPEDIIREDAIRAAFAALTPDATFFLDAQGRVARASASWVALFDTDGRSLLGKTIPELVAPEDRDEARVRIARATSDGTMERWIACLAPAAPTADG